MRKDNDGRDYFVSGSYTVEAALITSFILLVLFFVFQMTFFLTDEVRMEAMLAEESVRMEQGASETGEKVKQRDGFFLLSSDSVRAVSENTSVSISVSEKAGPLLPGKRAAVSVTYSRTKQKPVSYIRKIRALYAVLSSED